MKRANLDPEELVRRVPFLYNALGISATRMQADTGLDARVGLFVLGLRLALDDPGLGLQLLDVGLSDKAATMAQGMSREIALTMRAGAGGRY